MRLIVPLALAAALLVSAAPAHAAPGVDTTGTAYNTDRVVVPIVFPVLGATSYTDTFLSCRSGCERKHMGEDLMGAKMSPLVAACDGTVVSLQRETTVGGGNYLVIACDRGAAAGWSAVYIHVNNDTPGTDDGRGTASSSFPAGIAVGARVLAGQLVGWRGDSGDAESTAPHLHFELRKGDGWGGTVYSAYASLLAARHLATPTMSGPHPDGTLLRSSTGQLWTVAAGVKHPMNPGVLTDNGMSVVNAITTTSAELQSYANGTAVRIRSGALVRDPGGSGGC
jgi:murein DD-endopeptidase MepM/ murein hydrolase activator NlpD